MARFEYENETIQELYVQSYLVGQTIKELKVLRQEVSPVTVGGVGVWTATATNDLTFDTLTGTLPPMGTILVGTEKIQYGSITWSAAGTGKFMNCKRGWEGTLKATHGAGVAIYLADGFASVATGGITNVVTTIPFTSLDRPGQIPETGVVFIENEWIWYGAVAYTDINKTAGNLLYCQRNYLSMGGGAAAAHLAGVPIRFEPVFALRENIKLYNYTSSGNIIYYGFSPTITVTGDNALPILFGESAVIPLSGKNRVYVISPVGTATVAIAEWR